MFERFDLNAGRVRSYTRAGKSGKPVHVKEHNRKNTHIMGIMKDLGVKGGGPVFKKQMHKIDHELSLPDFAAWLGDKDRARVSQLQKDPNWRNHPEINRLYKRAKSRGFKPF